MTARRQFALMVLLGLSSSLGCKAMPWSKSTDPVPTAAAPNAGKHQYEALSKDFSSGSKAGGLNSPPSDDNWLVSGWKKTTAAVTAPFAAKEAEKVVAKDDPVSLSSRPGKIGPEVYLSAAQILENQGKFAEAEAKYQAALKASPKDLNAQISLARCYDRQGKFDEAVEAYKKAIKTHPKSPIAYNDLGLCYARIQRTEESVKHLEQAISLQPDNVRYVNNLANVLVRAGRDEEAYQRLARINSPAVAHYNVACLLHSHDRKEQAALHLQMALQKDNNLVQARELLATMPGHNQPGQNRVAAMPVSATTAQAMPASTYGAPGPSTPLVPQQQPVYGAAPSTASPAMQQGPYGAMPASPAAPAPTQHGSVSAWR